METYKEIILSHIVSLLLTFFLKHAYTLIKAGYVYIGQPPLYGIQEGKNVTYIKNPSEYYKYMDNRIVNNYDLYVKKDKYVKLDSKDFKELIKKTRFYTEELDKCANKYFIQPDLFEYLIYHGRTKNLNEKISEVFPEIEANKNKNGNWVVTGIHNDLFQSVEINSQFKSDTKDLFDMIKEYSLLSVAFKKKDSSEKPLKCSFRYAISEVTKKCEPKHKTRFKGLGRSVDDRFAPLSREVKMETTLIAGISIMRR